MNIQELINDKSTTIVDVRTEGEFAEGNVSGSINIPLCNRIEELKAHAAFGVVLSFWW